MAQFNDQLSRWKRLSRRKAFRRRAMRYGLIFGNLSLLVAAVVIVLVFTSQGKSSGVPLSNASAVSSGTSAADPLDKLSAADIAETVATIANLPEATAVRNQADSVSAQLAITPAENVVAAKPQIVATALKSIQDLVFYVSQPGDTVSSLASKFNVTSDSISWSNGLSSETIPAGTKLYIPPVNGVVYTVKPGDTAQSLAQKFGANAQQIITFNDAELGGLHPGERIVIPNGQLQPAYSPGTIFTAPSAGSFTATYGANGYDYGFCTWYVASQIPVPSNWGNASTWAYYAGLSGWTVTSTPKVGAIAQTPYAAGGEGHVAIVTAVKGNMIQYKDMNGIAGWGAVGYSGWVPASTYVNYIYH